MLNLYDYLSDLDKRRIDNYIYQYGTKRSYIGNKNFLSYWAKNKKKLFHLFGGKLVIDFPIVPTEFNLNNVDNQLWDLYSNGIKDFIVEVREMLRNTCTGVQGDFDRLLLTICNFTYDCLMNNECGLREKVIIKNPNKKSNLQLSPNTKFFKALRKILEYCDAETAYFDRLNIYLNKYSSILNEKFVADTLHLSIHPLDFLTMSDNSNKWTSCLSLSEVGVYRVGAVEMMNSNNVICAYLSSSKDYCFGGPEEGADSAYRWNNKKWRQLFYVTKDIIMGGKAYPKSYKGDEITLIVLEKLRELADINLKWQYRYGPEVYKDMKHIDNLYKMEKNREWIWNDECKKHNILIDTKGMYNDILNDKDYTFWCIRNRVPHNKIISISGEANCLCCNGSVLEDNPEFDREDYDSYNDRYANTEHLVCPDCRYDFDFCCGCGEVKPHEEFTEVDGKGFCSQCYSTHTDTCLCCGALTIVASCSDVVPVIYVEEKKNSHKSITLCEECYKDAKDSDALMPFKEYLYTKAVVPGSYLYDLYKKRYY